MWCYRNQLTLHTGQTEAMLICSNTFVGPMRPLMFVNSYINFSTKSTCLGEVINHKLHWKLQVKTLHTKFGRKLKFLKRMKGLPPSVLEEIYYKGIVSSYYLQPALQSGDPAHCLYLMNWCNRISKLLN